MSLPNPKLRSWRRFRPLKIWSSAEDPLSPRERTNIFFGLLLLGLAARGLRYVLRFPLWEDETFLCVNFIDKSFRELMGPLTHHQAAPIGFLWGEAAMVKTLGFNELSLRLIPFIYAMAALAGFAWLVHRLIRGTPALLALAFLAPAYSGIRYAAEAKQYSGDLFYAVLLLILAIEWWRNPRNTKWLWAIAIVTPLGVLTSFPAVFVAGGVTGWIAIVLWVRQQRSGIVPWATMVVMLLASFGMLYVISAGAQAESELGYMQTYWSPAFPPLTEPWKLPVWLVVTHASDLLSYPAGSERGGSTLTFIMFTIGLVMLWRRKRWGYLGLLLAPFLLTLIAAGMQRYPYGGHVKFSQHLGPAICIFAGLGLAAWLSNLRNKPDRGRRAILIWLSLLSAFGVGSMVRDTLNPHKTLSDMRQRAFAEWFWFTSAFDGEVRYLDVDFDLNLSPTLNFEYTWETMFRCNREIYMPDARPGGTNPREEHQRPLRCVLYRDPTHPFDEAGLENWLADMQTLYELTSFDSYTIPRYNKRENTMIHVDYLDIYTFLLRSPPDDDPDDSPDDSPVGNMTPND